MTLLDSLEHPIVQAPLAGGASTPELAAAVSEAGGLGFLAAGYKSADAVRADLATLRTLTSRPFGLNVFAPPGAPGDADAVRAFAGTLRGESERAGVALGEPRHDDDGWEAKLALAEAERLPLVTFTFGAPDAAVVERLRAAGAEVWVTVTSPAEARARARRGRRRARRPGRRGRRTPRGLRGRRRGRRPRHPRRAPADRRGGRPAARRHRRPRHRRRGGGRALRRRGSRAARHRVHALPRGGHRGRAPRGAGRRDADRPHARVQRAHRARDRQPLPARALGRRPAPRIPSCTT